jgi:2-C-methyl-D-erythritol 4-phosphate cytidylyltransferase
MSKGKYNKIARTFKKLFGVDHRDYYNSAIIVAAGLSERMKLPDNTTKQMIDICGLPVIVRTVLQFEACEDIDEIVLVVRKEEFELYKKFYKEYGFKKVSHIVEGGETRQKSVLNGLRKVNPEADYVTIHDGARCLITAKQISEVCTWAYHYGAATAAQKPTDTLKRCDGAFIKETVDRDTVFQATTPQIFKYDMYRAAAYSAKKDGITATDDNSLVERLNFKIYVCDLGYQNIKITNPEDICIAEAILRKRESENG